MINIIVQLLLILILFLSPLFFIKELHFFKNSTIFEKIGILYITGLCYLILPLQVLPMLFGKFKLFTYILFIIGCVSTLLSIYTYKKLAINFLYNIKIKFIKLNLFNISMLFFITLFIIKTAYFLCIKEILDWDATSVYLPYARAIVIDDTIPTTAFDHQIILYPIAICILYAWTYVISGSLTTELFRLFPLYFYVITIIALYMLCTLYFPKKIAYISIIIYTFLPMHDLILNTWSYYPDIPYLSLMLFSLYYLIKSYYFKNDGISNNVFSGITLGLSSLFKPQGILLVIFIPLLIIPLLNSKKTKILLLITISLLLVPINSGISGISKGFIYVIYEMFTSLINILFYSNYINIIILLFLTSILIYINVFRNYNPSNHLTLKEILIITTIIIAFAVPIYLSWYGRNLMLTGTIINRWYMDDLNYKWASSILQPIVGGNNLINNKFSNDFYLSSSLLFFTSPSLYTILLIPKIVGLIYLIKNNKNITPFINCFIILYIIFYQFFIFPINERWLYIFTPFVAILSAIGLKYINSVIMTYLNIDSTLLLLTLYGNFSLLQSNLLFIFKDYIGIYKKIILLILQTFQINWSIFAGVNVAANLSNTYDLIKNGIILQITIFIISLFLTSSVRILKTYLSKVKIKIIMNAIKKTSKKFLLLYCVLLLIFIINYTILPIFTLNYQVNTKTNMQVKNVHRELFGFQGLYSNVIPYLLDNCNEGDTVLAINAHFTGIQYYLGSHVKVIDLLIIDNLASLRSLIEYKNDSLIDLIKENNIKYILLNSPEFNNVTITFLDKTNILVNIQNEFNLTKCIDIQYWVLYKIIIDGKINVIEECYNSRSLYYLNNVY